MIWLALGGARSGKSELAERRAASCSTRVTYLATGVVAPADADFAERVRRHRARRPAEWSTIEIGAAGDLPGALLGCETAALVDSLGAWLAGFPRYPVAFAELTGALGRRRDEGRDTFLVSEEVGLGVHPSTDVGRAFRDALGDLNRAVADVADEVVLVVAGRTLRLEGEG